MDARRAAWLQSAYDRCGSAGAAAGDLAAQRAGDADREAIAERLRIAAGEGRIELWELDERLGQAYGAKTYGELAPLVEDLPAQPPLTSLPGLATEPETLVLRTTTSNIRQDGPWVVPRRITAESTTGWITIDFTAAHCAYREVTVEVITKTGWIQLILPDGWAAQVSPLSTYTGHISNRAAETADPGAPRSRSRATRCSATSRSGSGAGGDDPG